MTSSKNLGPTAPALTAKLHTKTVTTNVATRSPSQLVQFFPSKIGQIVSRKVKFLAIQKVPLEWLIEHFKGSYLMTSKIGHRITW